jgi:hypothetical protein
MYTWFDVRDYLYVFLRVALAVLTDGIRAAGLIDKINKTQYNTLT